jgi:hypothetical protein
VRDCGCDIGPGRYEGEGPEAAILDSMSGMSDDSCSEGDGGAYADLFRKPLNCDTDKEWRDHAIECGYCEACTDQAIQELNDSEGAILYTDPQGFRCATVYTDDGELTKAWDALLEARA